MADCGDGYGGGLDFAVRGGELFDRTEGAATEFAGNSVGPGKVCIHDSYQPDGFALLCQLVVDAGVVVPEGANANHGYVNELVGCQISGSQRN